MFVRPTTACKVPRPLCTEQINTLMASDIFYQSIISFRRLPSCPQPSSQVSPPLTPSDPTQHGTLYFHPCDYTKNRHRASLSLLWAILQVHRRVCVARPIVQFVSPFNRIIVDSFPSITRRTPETDVCESICGTAGRLTSPKPQQTKTQRVSSWIGQQPGELPSRGAVEEAASQEINDD